MASQSLQKWETERLRKLNEIESAHRGVGGGGRGRRYATQQINQAYAVLLSSQFQGFCRDLHSECVDLMVGFMVTTSPQFAHIALQEFLRSRKLDAGNPNPTNLGTDFNRLGVKFWDDVKRKDLRNADRQRKLEALNNWRNAIAHQDFDPRKLGGATELSLMTVRQWRNACEQLATDFDEVMFDYIYTLTGQAPW